jgi:hypothetical protein
VIYYGDAEGAEKSELSKSSWPKLLRILGLDGGDFFTGNPQEPKE